MKREKERLSKGAASGMVALVFLVLGFQLAIFVVKVVERPPRAEDAWSEPGMTAGQALSVREGSQSGMTAGSEPGVAEKSGSGTTGEVDLSGRSKLGGYVRPAAGIRPSGARKPGLTRSSGGRKPGRTYESFVFDPNTVSVADLQRLGLSERQAESIDNYRSKGGRFRSKADFRKMYVVSDTLFARLEAYIEIPKLELNTADSAALVALRGIGPYYARKILDYRERLGGFVDAAQLLEIEGIDADRLAGFSEDVTVDAKKIRKIDLWHASDTVLARHPYIGAKGARSVLRYRQLYDSARWTLPDLAKERALPPENIEKLKKYIEIQ